VALRLGCPRTELRCRVEVRLQRGKRRLARASTTIAGGRQRTLALRLTRSARRQLLRSGSLRVTAVLTATDAAGNRATTGTSIRLLAPSR